MDPQRLADKEKSQELLYDAYEAKPTQAKRLIARALKLDPENADAHNFLASLTSDPAKALACYEKAMVAGRAAIGEKEFKKLKGHFWGFFETRPYMRAKAGYADTLYTLGRVEESLQQYGEAIELNPSDNQGLRFRYAALLVQHDWSVAYEKLHRRYGDEGSALWLFTYALYRFKKEGASRAARTALQQAHGQNPHVLPYLTGEVPLPNELPEYYSPGQESEAAIYLHEAATAWAECSDAVEWAGKFAEG